VTLYLCFNYNGVNVLQAYWLWYQSVYLCISFPVVHCLLVFSHHSCWFVAFLDVKFICFKPSQLYFSTLLW